MTNQEIKTVGQTIAAETQIGGNTAARVGGVIEGIGEALDNKDAAVGYYLATMSGSTIYINASSYRLGTGGNLRAKMPAAATTACTLTVGNAQAVQLWYNGAAVSADNSWEAGEIVTIFYDGTRFMASNSQGGGGQFGSGEKIKDILLSQVLGAGTDAITSQKGVSDAIFNEIDISSIDTLKTLNDALAPSSSLKPTYYTVTAMLSSVKLKVGSMAVISDNMRHVVTEIMATHYLLDDAGNLTNEHSDAEIFFIYRSVKLSGGTLPDAAGVWTKWRYVNSSVMDEIPTAGSSRPAKSGGIYATTAGVKNGNVDSDLDIEDEGTNVLVRFANGHVKTKNFDSSKLPALATKNNEDFDFAIEDEVGDAIVLFQNGHIRTKNFNSETFSAANYLKDKFQGKKIAIVGDSISTYQGWLPSDVTGFTGTAYATYYPNGDVNSVDKTWWYQVALNLGILTSDIANTSWSGGVVCGDSTSTTNGKPACSTKRISDITIRGFNPDIIIVYIGCNDWYQCGLSGYSTILGTWAITDAVPAEGTIHAFRSAYALMLSKLQNAYPNARIFCCTILDDWKRDAVADDPSDNAWPSNDAAGYTTKQWNDNIKEIADAFACDVIDIHNCGITYYNIPSFAVDTGLHPNAAGHAMIARKVTSELMAKY